MTGWDERQHRRDSAGRFAFKRHAEADVELPAPVPGVLDNGDLRAMQDHFGVSEEQVRRDHAISHALAALTSIGTDEFVFFGGTALSRTHLPGLRLSEDIDLIALGGRTETAGRIQAALHNGLRRTLGAPSFSPPLPETRHPEPSVMQVGSSTIQIQLLSSSGYPNWPTEVAELEQRYRDAPPAQLRVLTPAAFVVAKLSSWSDRGAPRDLYDLWAMAVEGMIDERAVELFGRLGPFAEAADVSFNRLPTAAQWEAALAHQCRIDISPAEAASIVRDALTSSA